MIPIVRSRQSGFAIAGALALLAICAVFGVFFVKIFNLGQEDAARDAQSERAYQAARTAAEYGAYQSLVTGSCAASSLSLPAFPELAVALSCQRVATSEGGAAVLVDTWTALACSAAACPGTVGPGYIERQVVMSVAK